MIGGCFVIEFLDLNCTNKKINFVLFVDLMLLPDCLGIFLLLLVLVCNEVAVIYFGTGEIHWLLCWEEKAGGFLILPSGF